MHFLLFYEVADDYISRRTEFRNIHLKLGWEAAERGELVLGGALANPRPRPARSQNSSAKTRSPVH
jgi:hypothetical protein